MISIGFSLRSFCAHIRDSQRCCDRSSKYVHVILLIVCSLYVFSHNPVCCASEISSLVDETVDLTCEINEEKCGKIYFVTWSKKGSSSSDWTRVYLHSDDIRKPMESLANPNRATMFLNETTATLRISPVRVSDDGQYKCDVIYLGALCPSFVHVKLLTLVVPSRPEMSVNDVKVQDRSVVGPLLEGTQQTFKCESFGGKPSPTVTWTREGTPALSKPTWEVGPDGTVNASNVLTTTVARGDQGTKLTCKVEHNYTNTEYTFSVRLDVNVAPLWLELKSSSDETELVEGDVIEMLCRINGAKPAAKISWFNGTERMRVQPSSNVSSVPTDGTYVTDSILTFLASRYDHQTSFTCYGTNVVLKQKKKDPLSKSINLFVKYAPAVVVRPVGGLEVNETDSVILFCTYEANPAESLGVRWFVDGKSIDDLNGDYDRADKVSPPYLMITKTSREDEGEYTCGIRNDIGWGNSSNQAFITVFYPPDVIVRVTPRLISENGETSVSLSCLVTAANPENLIYVRWYKNGVIMNQTTERDIVWVGVDRTFTGNYSCQAQNSAGWGPISEDKELIVMYSPGQASLSASSVLPQKGEPLEMTCIVSDLGNPHSKLYEWMKDGKVITQTVEGNITIDYVTLSDQGNYSCAAVNAAGTGTHGFYFVKAYAKPFFIENLPPIFGVKKTSTAVSMSCTVECDPPCTVQWNMDGEDLDDSQLYTIKTSSQAEDLDRNLFESVVTTLYWNLTAWPEGMLDESLVDRSNFSCVSTGNTVGDGVSSTTMFRVEYAPTNAEIYPPEVNVTEHTVPNDVLFCDASAFPDPDFLWKFGEQVVSSEKTLIMNYNMTRDKAGTYTCIATNRHGTIQSSAVINVHYEPECRIEVSDADDQGRVNLTCVAWAIPLHTIDFVWWLDNETMTSDSMYDDQGQYYYSQLTVLQGDPDSYGQYQCVANNSIGSSEPCSFKITGTAPLLVDETDDKFIIIIIIIVVAIIILLIIIIICCIVCRRKNKNPDKMGKREGPIGGSEPTPPRPSDRAPRHPTNPGEPVYQNVSNSSTPKVKPMPRTKNRPLYENVPPPVAKPSEGPFKPDDDDLVYADIYDDIKMGKVPDPRVKPSLPPKKSKQDSSDDQEPPPSVQRPAPISNGTAQSN